MSRKISVLTTSHNAFIHDLSAVEKHVTDKGYLFEAILITAPDHITLPKSITGTHYREVIPQEKLGYYDCLRFGIFQSTGDYIYFLSSDSCIKDETFIGNAADLLTDGSDMVFARSEITSVHGKYIMQHPFRVKYKPVEFLKEWLNLRMIFVDYFGFSSILFKKELLMSSEAFISKFPDSIALDTAALIKYILMSKEIHFIEAAACTRNGPAQNINKTDKGNLTEQVTNHFSIPLDVFDFIKKKEIAGNIIHELNVFFNQYAVYAFSAIVSDYHQLSNDLIFECAELKNRLKDKKVYIYGHGWVGMALKVYLNENGITPAGFIDDYKEGENIVNYETFAKGHYEDAFVIIASYKCSDVLHIYKSLIKINGITVIDLLQC